MKKKKPLFDRTRPISWSAISSFEYDREQWYRKYCLGLPDPETAEMRFGKLFAQSVEDGKPMAPVRVLSKVEHKFEVMFGKIRLVGYADSFDDKAFLEIEEYKTGKKPWDQKRADEHGQITMYVLMNYITNKVHPEKVKCAITWVPTQDMGDFSIAIVKGVKPLRFETSRTMRQVLDFGARINRVVREMEEYAKNHA